MFDLEKIKIETAKVLEKYPVAFAYVYGSIAKKNQDSQSDLDLAIGFGNDFADITKQEMLIDELVGKPINKTQHRNILKPHLRNRTDGF